MMRIEKSIQLAQHTLTIATGEVAKQADAAVMVSLGDTVVLVTVVAQKGVVQPRDFLPLTVHYQERTYAAGRIPGGFFKREGRPAEHETLTARLIDRALRPMFADGFCNEIQVLATVLSLDPEILPDIPAMIGASAALSLAGLPFNGPLAALRVGYQDGIYQCNPTQSQLAESQLDLVVAGHKDAVVMVESEAKELSEEVMLGAILYGQEMMQSIIQAINELTQDAGTTAWDWQPEAEPVELKQALADAFKSSLEQAYQVRDKQERVSQLRELKAQALEKFVNDDTTELTVHSLFKGLEKKIVRGSVLSGEPRIDGRDRKTVRDITAKTSWLPRTHGSALFTRGETQAIVVATLGTDRDGQIIDAISGERKERFMLHYNFPAYSVGEIGMPLSPKRREIGHGNLAKRAMKAVMPDPSQFPYAIRVVSEITESNGSSSMASVCGTSLALMDAGVPVKSPVSGVAMGLIKEGDNYAILTDILGDEDHLGDMDFKVAGTSNGVTALQMDIKVDGLNKAILQDALAQAYDGRMHILSVMNQQLQMPREQMSQHAPRAVQMEISPDKIKDVIGKGGATIRQMTDGTGVSVDIEDTGHVRIFGVDQKAVNDTVERIKLITTDVEVGAIYQGKVNKILDFGAFVSVLPGRDGLLHISQISDKRINDIHGVLSVGQEVTVKVMEIDKQNRIRLTASPLLEVEEA